MQYIDKGLPNHKNKQSSIVFGGDDLTLPKHLSIPFFQTDHDDD
jgi:hypothetical protein